MTSREEDEAWRAIVENYGERATLDERADSAPSEDDTDTEPEDPGGPLLPGPGLGPSAEDEPAAARPSAPYDEPIDHEDEGFIPPDPPVDLPPPPRLLAWLGLFGSPALVLLFVLAGATVPQWLGMALLAAFIGGFGYLLWTMPHEPRNPWDDGSRL